MRRVRYVVAMSLDGFIAGPNDESDWIIMDPEIDFDAIFAEFDTVLIGRRSFEGMVRAGRTDLPGMQAVIFSGTLDPAAHPNVRVVSDEAAETVSQLKQGIGKDIWVFGGGLLFRSLLELGLVDTVEVAVIPVLLGEGIPLLPTPAPRRRLTLEKSRVYERTGIVGLEYAIDQTPPNQHLKRSGQPDLADQG